jgi:hypothetical protein
MKKKIIFTLTICLFTMGSIFNMQLAQNDHNMDISLADISVMAQAGDESTGNLCMEVDWSRCYWPEEPDFRPPGVMWY